jgi:putative DNA methylase
MSNTDNPESKEQPLKIEDFLPVTAVGIESLKEANPEVMSPHRNIYKWFARRPTAATRLALLASVLPGTISDDQLLRWMCVGPKEEAEGTIEDFVVNKQATKSDSSQSVTDHFGYDYPLQNIPPENDMEEFHNVVRDYWGGSLPTVLDPTAGGGTIPLESLRYELPTISNELNPVAWLLNKVVLDYALTQGSLEREVRQWIDEVLEFATEELEEYFPRRDGAAPSHYFRAYSIECPSCGQILPLTNRWWFNRRLNMAVRPLFQEDDLRFECVNVEETDVDFDPNEGTVSGGDAECPHCSVVTERDDLVAMFQSGDFEYEVLAVRYNKKISGSKYHSPLEQDYEAIEKAREKVENDLHLATLLTSERFEGHWDRAYPYGVTQWRDVYSPRQLLSHAKLLEGFKNVEERIHQEYDSERAESILVLLSLVSTKLIERNSRLEPIDVTYGSPANMLGNNNFSFQWSFGESNLTTGTYSLRTAADNVLDNYETVVQFLSHVDEAEIEVHQGDAANLSLDDSSVDVAVMDPPYGDNVIYSEVADAFYAWLKEYLGGIFPQMFSSSATNKEDEAVENPAMVSEGQETTARERYETKMSDIFSEVYRVLDSGGVLTVYFTDKEASAWDSLTMGLINSGFTVTATHTVTSEMPQRVGVQGSASADSTLLLTCRKPAADEEIANRQPVLWSDIRAKTREAARNKANDLLDSELNLTKTDTIISAFGPTLRVFTENYPVVDKHDELVRPQRALEEARTAVVEVLVDRELEDSLDDVDNLSTWYILSWLVYGRETIPYDDARQLGLGVGVNVDDIKSDTKIWSKSGDKLTLKGQSYRVRDYTALESGEKRRKRAYPVDPREDSYNYAIDAVHAALNVLETKGSDFTWNWLNDRGLADHSQFRRTIKSLLQVLPETHEDHASLVNLVSGETGELLDIDTNSFSSISKTDERNSTKLSDF